MFLTTVVHAGWEGRNAFKFHLSLNWNQLFFSIHELLTTASAQGMNHCVDLMALFTKMAALVVRTCAKHLMARKVPTLGSGTLWYTIGHVLAVGCSDSD